MDPIQTLGAVLEAIKRARDVAKRLKDAEVQAILLDAQERALTLQEELLTLRAENLTLKQRLAVTHDVTFQDGTYWKKTAAGREGPFCSRCYDVEGLLVRLQYSQGFWPRCPACNKTVGPHTTP